MLAFIVSRLLQSLAVMLAVSFLCFALFNFVGDPVNNMVGQVARPVSDLIAERMPATLELVAAAALLALAMGIPLGVLTALRRHKLDSGAIMTFSLAGGPGATFVAGIHSICAFLVVW